MRTADQLSQAQLQVLRLIRDQPDTDAWNLKQAANCSLAELGELASLGLIDIGTDRLEVDRMHPVIAEAGLTALAEAEDRQTAPPDEPLSPARQIERLEEGLDRGCVSEEQFQALKRQILE
jgi:hypothetical protein